MDKRVLTPREARIVLGIGRTRFYQLLAEGKLRFFKNGRRYLIPESALNAFVEEQTAQSMKENIENGN